MRGGFNMKKIIITTVTVLALMLLLQLTCFAWVPSCYLDCTIDYTQIPENAVYVELLLPISPDDENYTEYNQTNGEKFNILSDSEIVSYCQDGFMSYTYHLSDAKSKPKPFYFAIFKCDFKYYENNKSLFDKLNALSVGTKETTTWVDYAEIYLDDDSEDALTKIYSDLGYSIEWEKNHTQVIFFNDLSDGSRYWSEDYYGFCEQYKKAKMAYLDESGNIISVSNEVDIYKNDLFDRYPQTSIKLKGNELSCEFSYGPPWFIIPIIFFVMVAGIAGTVITICIVVIVEKVKAKKKSS